MTTETYYTYNLVDPITKTVHYVGATKHPERRLYEHLNTQQGKKSKIEWIESLSNFGLAPEMIITGSFETIESARASEIHEYTINNNGQLFCENPKQKFYNPVITKLKHPISLSISSDVLLLLKKLAEKENRSQGQQIEHMIKAEADKLGIKPDEPGK